MSEFKPGDVVAYDYDSYGYNRAFHGLVTRIEVKSDGDIVWAMWDGDPIEGWMSADEVYLVRPWRAPCPMEVNHERV